MSRGSQSWDRWGPSWDCLGPSWDCLPLRPWVNAVVHSPDVSSAGRLPPFGRREPASRQARSRPPRPPRRAARRYGAMNSPQGAHPPPGRRGDPTRPDGKRAAQRSFGSALTEGVGGPRRHRPLHCRRMCTRLTRSAGRCESAEHVRDGPHRTAARPRRPRRHAARVSGPLYRRPTGLSRTALLTARRPTSTPRPASRPSTGAARAPRCRSRADRLAAGRTPLPAGRTRVSFERNLP